MSPEIQMDAVDNLAAQVFIQRLGAWVASGRQDRIKDTGVNAACNTSTTSSRLRHARWNPSTPSRKIVSPNSPTSCQTHLSAKRQRRAQSSNDRDRGPAR